MGHGDFERHQRWHIRNRLDVASMNRAVKHLLGEHDYRSFQGSKCDAKSSIRSIDHIAWERDGDTLRLDVFGRSFLKQMVRIIVGTCLAVGRGRLLADDMKRILDKRDRRVAGQTAPARGLCLMRVFLSEEEYRRALEKSTKAR